jgi:hypothetical protein
MSARKIEMWVIVWIIAEDVFMVDSSEIFTKNKKQGIVNARRIAVTLCFQYGNRVKDIERYYRISRSYVYACVKRQSELNELYPAEHKIYQECERRCLNAK